MSTSSSSEANELLGAIKGATAALIKAYDSGPGVGFSATAAPMVARVRSRIVTKQPKSIRSKTRQALFGPTDRMPRMAIPPHLNADFRFHQLLPMTQHTTGTASETFFSYTFALSQLSQVATFTALYDSYRVDLLEWWMTPRITNVTNSAVYDAGRVCSWIDLDDAAAAGVTLATATQHESAEMSNGLVGHYRQWVPYMNLQTGGVQSATVCLQWLDCGDTAPIHHGVKVVHSSTTTAQTYDIYMRAHVSFRRVR